MPTLVGDVHINVIGIRVLLKYGLTMTRSTKKKTFVHSVTTI